MSRFWRRVTRHRCGSCGAATPTAATPRSSTTVSSVPRRASCSTRPRRCSRCGPGVVVLFPRIRQSTRGIACATAAPCRRRDALRAPRPGARTAVVAETGAEEGDNAWLTCAAGAAAHACAGDHGRKEHRAARHRGHLPGQLGRRRHRGVLRRGPPERRRHLPRPPPAGARSQHPSPPLHV